VSIRPTGEVTTKGPVSDTPGSGVPVKNQPYKYALAECGLGSLGIILSDAPIEVTYSDGAKAMAWVGLHLTDKVSYVGAPWASRNPKIVSAPDPRIGRIKALLAEYDEKARHFADLNERAQRGEAVTFYYETGPDFQTKVRQIIGDTP